MTWRVDRTISKKCRVKIYRLRFLGGIQVNSEKIRRGLWSAIGGAIVLVIVGFSWGGWVTGGTAKQTAEKMAADAVTDRLASISAAQFNQDLEKDQKLKKLEETNTWERDDYVAEQGWATMPGEKEADSKVAGKCAKLLV